MRRVYVAGASSERDERAKPVIAALRDAGFAITHDWTKAVDMYGANGDSGLSAEGLKECALADFRGVMSADVLLLLAPRNASTGAWVELGVMLGARGFGGIVIAGDVSRCIFGHLVARKFVTDEAAVAALIQEAQ